MSAFIPRTFSYGALFAPTAFYSPVYSALAYILDLRPISNAKRLIADSNNMRSALITGLHLFSYPTHITFFVMSIVVNSVYGMFGRWAATDFYKKLIEGIKSKFNSFCAISGVIFSLFILAASFSVEIDAIFSCNISNSRLAVSAIRFGGNFALATTTGSGQSAPKISAKNIQSLSAFTATKPIGFTGLYTDKPDNRQATENLIFQINKSRRTRLFHINSINAIRESVEFYTDESTRGINQLINDGAYTAQGEIQ